MSAGYVLARTVKGWIHVISTEVFATEIEARERLDDMQLSPTWPADVYELTKLGRKDTP